MPPKPPYSAYSSGSLRRGGWRGKRIPALLLALSIHAAILLLFLGPKGDRSAEERLGTGDTGFGPAGPVMVVMAAYSRAPSAPAQIEATSAQPPEPPSSVVPPGPAPLPITIEDLTPQTISAVNPLAQPQILRPLKTPLVSASNARQGMPGAQGGPAGDRCGMLPRLQAALQNDADVHAALARLPRQGRSVANAVMIWDRGWVGPASAGAPVLEPVRSAIARAIQSSASTCRDDQVAGPRFLTVADADGETILAVGSGVWRWVDLADQSSAVAP